MRRVEELVDAVADAVLYEGYLLYPYRPSAVKNQVRWTFGGVLPRCWSEATGGEEPWRLEAQSLLQAGDGCRLDVTVRFLHLLQRVDGGGGWQEATERAAGRAGLVPSELVGRPARWSISLEPAIDDEDGVRREWRRVEAEATLEAESLGVAGCFRLTLGVANLTPLSDPAALGRDQAVLHGLASTHAVLRAAGGRFVSLADPPEPLRAAAAGCRCRGWWPILVGEPGSDDCLLLSPIIMEDHPQVAAESPGDLFDATEIDELLTLRILTLSEEEKREVRRGDERARRLLERSESLTPEQLMRLHGAVRGLRPVRRDQ